MKIVFRLLMAIALALSVSPVIAASNPGTFGIPRGAPNDTPYPSLPIVTPEMFENINSIIPGTTNESAAIQAAFDWRDPTSGSPAHVVFQCRVYKASLLSLDDGVKNYDGITVDGCDPYQGVILSGSSSLPGTEILDTTNNDTLTIGANGASISSLTFISPQPIITTGAISGGVISSLIVEWPGIALTNGVYSFTSSGGGCSQQLIGTLTVVNGTVSTSGPTAPAVTQNTIGCAYPPAVIYAITGGGQTGSYVRLLEGAKIKFSNMAYVGKWFGENTRQTEVTSAAAGSFLGHAIGTPTVISFTNTAPFTVGMLCVDLTYPPALRRAAYISAISTNVSITLAAADPATENSRGAADILSCGTGGQIVGFENDGPSYIGQKYYGEFYQTFDGEGFSVNRPNFNGEQVGLAGSYWLGITQEEMNFPRAESYALPHTMIWQFQGMPNALTNVSCGNVYALAVDDYCTYINGYFPGVISPANGSMTGGFYYGPLTNAILLEGIQWSHIGPITSGVNSAGLVMDNMTECNVLEFASDQTNIGTTKYQLETLSGSATSLSAIGNSPNWIKSAYGETLPSVTVTASTYTIPVCVQRVGVDTTGGAATVNLPTIPNPASSNVPVGGLKYTIVNEKGGNAVTVGTLDGKNIIGSSTYSLAAANNSVTIDQSPTTTQWDVIASH